MQCIRTAAVPPPFPTSLRRESRKFSAMRKIASSYCFCFTIHLKSPGLPLSLYALLTTVTSRIQQAAPPTTDTGMLDCAQQSSVRAEGGAVFFAPKKQFFRTMTSPSPSWQVRLGGVGSGPAWTTLDQKTSGLLEGAFLSGASIVPVSGILGFPTQPFNVDDMEVAGLAVRRTAAHAVSTSVSYWDDEDWVPMDSYTQCLIHTAISVSRQKTVVYIGNSTYDIFLQTGQEKQINRDSGMCRPLRVQSGVSMTVLGSAQDEKETDVEDDPAMPNEFRCPITHMVMRVPVVAADGHSYELKALQKWLLKKQTSPVTGATISGTNLIMNRSLKKLINDWPQTARTTARTTTEIDDDDLFGSSDEDEPAKDDRVAIEAASSSSSAPPPLKRMKKPAARSAKAKL